MSALVAAAGAISISALIATADLAGAATPGLKITPSTIYYPCSEGTVKFTVKSFAADKKVKLRTGSATGPVVATMQTNAAGKGSASIDFNNVEPGSYPYVATHGAASAAATLTVGECP